MDKQLLLINQIDRKITSYTQLKDINIPDQGWIKSIRIALSMTLKQLGKRMKITPQSVKEIEEREEAGTISINVLKKFANSLGMKFVYGFIPEQKSLENMIEERALEVAKKIVMRTAKNMELEDQLIPDTYLQKSIQEMKTEIIREMPNYLWD